MVMWEISWKPPLNNDKGKSKINEVRKIERVVNKGLYFSFIFAVNAEYIPQMMYANSVPISPAMVDEEKLNSSVINIKKTPMKAKTNPTRKFFLIFLSSVLFLILSF